MNSYAVLYSKDLPYFTELNAHFVSDGPSQVTLSGNHGDRAQVGIYETILAPETVATLKSKLLAAQYRTLPEPKRPDDDVFMPGMPDVPSLMVGLWDITAEAPEVRGFFLGLVPPEIQPVVDDLEAQVDEVLKHPKYVLAGGARWEQTELRAGDELSFVATLKNVGTQHIRIATPGLADSNSGDVPWTLTFMRPDPTTKGDVIVDNGSFRLKPENLREDSSRKRFWSKDQTKLAPQQELVIKFKKKVHLSPGDYKALLIFSTPADKKQDDDLVGGTLQIELPRLKVIARRSP